MTTATTWPSNKTTSFCIPEATPGDEQGSMDGNCHRKRPRYSLFLKKITSRKYPSVACYYIRFSCSFAAAVFKFCFGKKKQTRVFTQGSIHLLFHCSTCPCRLPAWSSRTAGMTHLCMSTALNDVFSGGCFCKRRRKDKDLSSIPHHLPTLPLSSTFFEAAKSTVVESFRLLNARLMCSSPLHNERHHNSRASASSSPR